jgi:hypothetical protein
MKKKRLETLSDYLCWNLKLIDTKEFLKGVKKLGEYVYSRVIFKGEKIFKKVKVLITDADPRNIFDELNPKFNIYKDKRNKCMFIEKKFLVLGMYSMNTQSRKKAKGKEK